MHVRQRAWLDAVPDAPDLQVVSRLSERNAQAKPERVARGKKILEDGAPLPLPEIDAVYLVDALFDVGPVKAGGMGPVPIDSHDLVAWQAERGIVLTPWEAQTLRRLSRDYVFESSRATKPDCPPPWTGESTKDRRERAEKQIRGALRALK